MAGLVASRRLKRLCDKRLWSLLICLVVSSCGNVPESENNSSPFDRFENRNWTEELEVAKFAEVPSEPPLDAETNLEQLEATAATNYDVENDIRRCDKVRYTCVVDGDTLWFKGVKIRVADIDTPEISQPQCAFEKELGEQATERFIELLNAGPFLLAATSGSDEDRYGRKLRVIMRDGKSLGDQLVAEGLAHEWGGSQLSWC